MALIDRKPAVLKKVKLATIREHYLLVCIVLLSLALRLLWLKTVIEGDEGIYGYIAMLWSRGYLPYVHSLDYSNYNKPPLHYFIYLISISLFGNTIIPIRMINNILFLVSIVILYLIANDWYGKKVGLIAALFYGIFMNTPVFQAHQAMSEPFSVFFALVSIYFCNKYLRDGGKNKLFISGISISAASLINQMQSLGVFVLLLMLTLFLKDSYSAISKNKPNFAKILAVDTLVLLLGILLPALFFTVYFWSRGALDALIQCTLLYQAAHYFSRPNVPFGVRFLTVVEGLPLWLFSIFGFILCTFRRNKLDIFLISWMLFLLPVAIMPPNFGHHFVMVMPQASILSAVSLVLILNNVTRSNSIRKFLRDYKENMATIFVIATLIISFVPSIFLQTKHYPDTGINLGFVTWNVAGDPGPWTYEKQLELASYLKSNISENGQIFIHGWVVTPYWLSGHRAPTNYIYTVEIPGVLSIPEEEILRLTGMVKDGVFECIVLFSEDLERLEWKRDADPVVEYDPIVDYTIQKYFYVKNISYARIFTKYNSNGEYIDYLFMEHFPDALKEYKLENGTIGDTEKDFEKQWALIPEVSVPRMNISGDARDAIRHHPIPSAESYIRYNDVYIPPNSKLRFGIAIYPGTWYQKGGDGTQFKIYIEDGKRVDEVFNRYINPKQNIEERKWNDYEIDLTVYGGKKVNIIFVTTPGPANDNYNDWAYWSAPRIYVKS